MAALFQSLQWLCMVVQTEPRFAAWLGALTCLESHLDRAALACVSTCVQLCSRTLVEWVYLALATPGGMTCLSLTWGCVRVSSGHLTCLNIPS